MPASTVFHNKTPDTILNSIFNISILKYGTTEEFVSENGEVNLLTETNSTPVKASV